MASAGEIRAGRVAVEVGVNDAGLTSGLTRAAAQIKQAAASANASADQGFGAGGGDLSFKWAQRIARGAGIGILAHTVGSAMSGLADILKGEWENVGKAIEGVPILGGAAMSLANGFDDLFLGIRDGMKKMKDEALKGLKETQAVLDAVMREVTVKNETAAIGASPFNRKLMDIDAKALKDALAEYKKADEAGGITPANLGVLSAIEARRVKEKAAAFGEQSLDAGNEQLKRNVEVQERASQAARKWEDALFAMDLELRQSRGEIDALSAREAQERRNLKKELESGAISAEQYRSRLATLAVTYDELALAEEGRKQAAEREAERAAGKALTESLRTPEEKAGAEIDGLRKMLAAGDITGDTFDRAIRKTLQDAAAAMPDVLRNTTEVRGTFNPMEAAGMGGGGMADQMLDAQRKTAKNTEKIAQLAAALGVTFS